MKTIFYIVIIIILLLGMITVIIDLFHHLRNKKGITKSTIKWKVMLLVIGITIFFEKVQYLFNIYSNTMG